MSEVAGRMAAQIGAQFLEKPKGGKGILLAGVPGVSRGKVTIIGGGVVGTNAAKMAVGLGADASAPRPTAIFAAFVPTTPPPIIVTFPRETPGTPASRMPFPPLGFSKN